MKKGFPNLMKLVTTYIMMGMLVTGLLLSPFVSGFPFITKVFAQEDADRPVKQVLLVANENKVKVAPDNALHPGGIEYGAMTFNGTIPGPAMAVDQGNILKFRFSEQELNQYQREPPSIWDSDNTKETTTHERETNEESIPLTEERLDVSKKSQENQATITKKTSYRN